MWTKVDNHDVVADIKPGDIITTIPGRVENEYIIQKIQYDYVQVIHSNGIASIKVFTCEELLKGTWWLKK